MLRESCHTWGGSGSLKQTGSNPSFDSEVKEGEFCKSCFKEGEFFKELFQKDNSLSFVINEVFLPTSFSEWKTPIIIVRLPTHIFFRMEHSDPNREVLFIG
jgi:hypothetical protein